jgi:thiamine-phosphate pyrophosphorylase
MFDLVVISHADMLPGEAAIIQQLFEAGLECFHLRKPEADEQAVRALIEAIPAVYHNRIAMHGFFHLVEEYDIQRWHFREEHRRTTDEGTLLQLQEKGYILSTSVHDLQTLQQLPALFSYTFFSPVFDSISKQEYKGFAGDDFYIRDEQKPVRVIALGGIDAGNVQSVMAMNFDGAALLGVLWKEPANAVENFKRLKEQLNLNPRSSAKTPPK